MNCGFRDEDSRMKLVDQVRRLIAAENEGDPKKAEPVLAHDFVAITRRNGEEQGRRELLQRIGSPPSPNPIREPGDFLVWESDGVGVVRSLVVTKDPETRAVLGHFRNLHVFTKQAEVWACITWQVTEIRPGQ
jgi:hypothetical protein